MELAQTVQVLTDGRQHDGCQHVQSKMTLVLSQELRYQQILQHHFEWSFLTLQLEQTHNLVLPAGL